ncbi:MAG: ATP-binding protein [bacterium]
MKIVVIIFITFLSVSNLLYTWDIYPYEIKEVQTYAGGKLLQTGSLQNPLFYLVKTNWIDEEQVIFNWTGFNEIGKKGISIGSNIICDAEPVDNNLLILLRDGFQYKVALFDKYLKEISSTYILITVNGIDLKAEFIGHLTSGKHLALIDNKLILINVQDFIIKIEILDDNVNTAKVIKNNGKNYILDVKRNKQFGIVNLYSSTGKFVFTSRVELLEEYTLYQSKNYIIVATSRGDLSHTFLQFIDKRNGIVRNIKWIKTGINLISFSEDDDSFYYLNKSEIESVVEKGEYKKNKFETDQSIKLPDNFSKPLALISNDDLVYVFFQQGLIILSNSMTIKAINYYHDQIEYAQPVQILRIDNKVLISSKTHSSVISLKANNYWLFERIFAQFWFYLLPSIFLLFTIIFIRLYLRQLSLNERLLNLKSTGILFWIDRSGRLRMANDAGKSFLGISGVWQIKKHFAYYCNDYYTKPVLQIVEVALASREDITEKLNIETPEGDKEWLCTITPIRNVAGIYQGVVFTGIDITEQLERKRLSNWAQLAHDMQTNLMTIKLNAENLVLDDASNDSRRNKILHQTKVLINRVRDIVTVGRQEKTNKTKVNAFDICSEALSEFDETLYPNIEFLIDSESFIVLCDKKRMVRALRNAVENSIKSISSDKRGIIILNSKRDGKEVNFSIRDTGRGMDEEILNKMMNPYFSTGEGKGGFGIGTMIIKRVIEQHGGKLMIKSEIGKGTELIITIPNYETKANS